MPDHCLVLGVTPFMRSLLAEAVRLPREYDVHGRDGALMLLIQHEILQLPHLPLSLPLPVRDDLARRCHAFLFAGPTRSDHRRLERGARIRPRTFTRMFRRETGLTFTSASQALFVSVAAAGAGETVTSVALELGYDNPAAFTAMFKRMLGAPPRAYFRHGRD